MRIPHSARSVVCRLVRSANFGLEAVERRLLMSVAGSDEQLPAQPTDAHAQGAPVVVTSTDTPLAMPDDRTTRFSNLNVVGIGGVILDLNVSLNITHTFNGDLDIFLISPNNTRVELMTDCMSGADGMNLTLDDEAATAITAAPTTGLVTGTFRPEGLLSTFDLGPSDGLWRLEWTDDAGTDSGTLNSWSMTIDAGPPPDPGTIAGTVFGDYDGDGSQDAGEPGLAGWTVYIDVDNDSIFDATEASRVTGADGTYEFSLFPGTYRVREVLQAGFVQTSPGSGGMRPLAPSTPAVEPAKALQYTSTEVLVRVNDLRGLRALDRFVRDHPAADVSGMVDPASSAQIFKIDGDSLVNLRLRTGVDPLKAIETLQTLDLVQYAEPNISISHDPREFTPNDAQFGGQYHHPLMQNVGAWDTTLGDPRVKIGITDDGFALSHPDLYQNIWVNPGEIPATRLANLTDINGDGYISMVELNHPSNIGPFKVNDVNADGRIDFVDLSAAMGGGGTDDGTGGWTNGVDEGGNGFADDVVGRDFWSNDNNPNPDSSGDDHGTHVAGIAAARTNNTEGVSGTAGGATIVPIKFYGGGRTWTSTDVLNAYTYAANNGIKILSTSYNVDGFVAQQAFQDALNYMYNNGVLHFNSAGNNAEANPVRQRFDTSIYVVNTTSADVRSSSSNIGWGTDVSAPGTDILATALGATLTTYNYELKTGTSMATPNAAGVAALIWSAHPTWTREQVAAALIGTADNINSLQTATVNGLVGSGRVNSNKGVGQTVAPPKFKSTTNTPLLAGLPAEGATITTAPTAFTLDVANVFDPATMVAGNFSLVGNGLDDAFGTSDDVNVPLTLRFGDAAAPTHAYQVGTNRLFFTINGGLGSDTFRFTASAALQDPFGQALDGNGDGTGGDALTRTFNLIGPTNPFNLTITSGGASSGNNFGNKDIRRPVITGETFEFESARRVNFAFDENVAGSVSAADLLLENLNLNSTIPSNSINVTFDSVANTARFLPQALPNGNYRATFAAAGAADPYGNTNLAAATFNFFVLDGDADRNRSVNIDDFGILAANFNTEGTYSQGDFDYSRNVDIDDFAILAGAFNTTLPDVGSRPAGGAQDASAPPAALPSRQTVFGQMPITHPLDELTDVLGE